MADIDLSGVRVDAKDTPTIGNERAVGVTITAELALADTVDLKGLGLSQVTKVLKVDSAEGTVGSFDLTDVTSPAVAAVPDAGVYIFVGS